MRTRICSRKLRSNSGRLSQNFAATANFLPGLTAWRQYGDHLVPKSTRSIATSSYDGGKHFIKQEDYNYEEEEQIKLMYEAVYQLSDIEKALVFMYLEDKDYHEISETLGISEVNARVKMNRIKTKLKKILNP
jgi:RNA polymerase sigma factor (sigma-70 family)